MTNEVRKILHHDKSITALLNIINELEKRIEFLENSLSIEAGRINDIVKVLKSGFKL